MKTFNLILLSIALIVIPYITVNAQSQGKLPNEIINATRSLVKNKLNI